MKKVILRNIYAITQMVRYRMDINVDKNIRKYNEYIAKILASGVFQRVHYHIGAFLFMIV